MGRHRFEDQIREKLGSREIKPTEGSWNKLSQRLDAEDKTSKPIFWWIGIAASLAGGLLIAGLVFNGPAKVETPIADVPSKNIMEEKADSLPGVENNIASENVITKTPPSVKTENSYPEQKITQAQKGKVIANSEVKKNEEIFQPEPAQALATIVESEEINKKVEEILATVMSNEGNEEAIYSDEIEALLSKAALELSIEKQNSPVTTNISPEELLYDVEMELEKSFRDKVFEILKDGYLKARTAVANRNYPN